MPPRLVLIGPPGAGKTSIARELGVLWNLPVCDTDHEVERDAGMDVASIFVQQGEAEFRRLERKHVGAALRSQDGVVALGGGAVLDKTTQKDLEKYVVAGGNVAYVQVSLNVAASRVGFDKARPLLVGNPRQQWRALMEIREPIYTSLATLTVTTDELSPQAAAHDIARRLS